MVVLGCGLVGTCRCRVLRGSSRRLDERYLVQSVGLAIDNDLRRAVLDCHGADHTRDGRGGSRIDPHRLADQRVGLELRDAALRALRALQRAELGQLRGKRGVRLRIERVLRRHLRHKQLQEVLLRQRLRGQWWEADGAGVDGGDGI